MVRAVFGAIQMTFMDAHVLVQLPIFITDVRVRSPVLTVVMYTVVHDSDTISITYVY
jgi:hypothetical protein